MRHVDLFHTNCPKGTPVDGITLSRLIRRVDEVDERLNQATLVCEDCQAQVHVDCWPVLTAPTPPLKVWGLPAQKIPKRPTPVDDAKLVRTLDELK